MEVTYKKVIDGIKISLDQGTVIFNNIPLADFPYVIVERSEVKIG